jgi:hypothetical protein
MAEFAPVISRFVGTIRSLRSTLPLVASTVQEAEGKAKRAFASYLEKHSVEKEPQEDGTTNYTLPAEHAVRIRELAARTERTAIATQILPRTFIVSLVSEYDAYLGDLVRVLYNKQPALIDSSEKQFAFSEIAAFPTIEDLRSSVIDKEVDTLLRESHADQIEWLERQLGLILTRDLKIWPDFIEITERRNLFVHTGGKVTAQYITNCNRHAVLLSEEVKIGEFLTVEPEYFVHACDVILEVGVKLAHVLWRKIAAGERAEADTMLNVTCYNLIHVNEFPLAIELLTFATETIRKHSSEEIYLYMRLNKAQAHKWSAQITECNSILDEIDWTAKSPKFRMVRLALRDEFDDAASLMQTIGPNGEVSLADYYDWPVFREFRRSDQFKSALREVFGVEFQLMESAPTAPSNEEESPARNGA